MALPGRKLVVKVATDSGGTPGAFNTVQELRSCTMNTSGGTIDVSQLGDDWRTRISGLRDGTYTLAGFWSPGDTTGQGVLRTAVVATTEAASTIWVQVLPDGAAGFQQQVRVTSHDINTTVDGAVETSYNLEGSGAVTAV